jgi:hypothetical protein
VFLRDLCAETLETFDVEIDGSLSDGATAGQRNPGVAATGHEWAQDQRGGAHGFNQLVGGFRSGECKAVNGRAMLGPPVSEFDFGAHGSQEVACGLDVAHLGNVFEDDRLIGEQSGGHAGERGILSAADADRAQQGLSAAKNKFVHVRSPA